MEYTERQFEKPTDDYLRVATVSPEVAIADVPANVARITEAYRAAQTEEAELVVTPELSLTGYSTADLFHNQHVLEQSQRGLAAMAQETVAGPALVVGAPLEHNGVLYNCAVMLAEGKIAGAVPKVNLPNYKEFYDYRWFTSGGGLENQQVVVEGQAVPLGTDLLFEVNGTTVGMEVCEDLFAPVNPGTEAALQGAEVIVNLSASNELIGKADYRRMLAGATSGKLICAYVYASAGRGESVADVIYGGHQFISEDGRFVAERPAFSKDTSPMVWDIDRTYLEHDRHVNKTWASQAAAAQQAKQYRRIEIGVAKPGENTLDRYVNPHPFVPSNPETLDQRCEELFSYRAQALAQRARDSKAETIVLGLSGGLDSTLSLLTALEASKLLDKPNSLIHTVTMPGMASSERTQDNATLLAEALGTAHKVIPISDMAGTLLESIGHDRTTEDVTYENAQARMRTTILMNYANFVHGFVEGTGDMSENAIGWCTYNGDHMSMYNPNGAIPKTLVRHLVSWYAENRAEPAAREILRDILATPISPELTGNGDLSQTTEDLVGPYELTDFFLSEHARYGSRPNKIGYLAMQAFADQVDRYDEQTITKRLDTFLQRFTNSQWKREAAPNSTKVGTISLSQRGDLRMAPNTSPDWYK